MSFWSSETFLARVTSENIIDPFCEDNLKYSSYELCIGDEVFVTSDGDGTKKSLTDGQQFTIPPGQFALLITNEIVNIPDNALGFISIKAGVKFSGLINVSGFHVDPGFKGKLKFAVYNAGCSNIVLTQGMNLFMLWLSNIDCSTSKTYQGEHFGQAGITNEDVMKLHGEIASPASLNSRLVKLEDKYEMVKNVFWTIAVGLAVTVIGGIVTTLIYDYVKENNSTNSIKDEISINTAQKPQVPDEKNSKSAGETVQKQ